MKLKTYNNSNFYNLKNKNSKEYKKWHSKLVEARYIIWTIQNGIVQKIQKKGGN